MAAAKMKRDSSFCTVVGDRPFILPNEHFVAVHQPSSYDERVVLGVVRKPEECFASSSLITGENLARDGRAGREIGAAHRRMHGRAFWPCSPHPWPPQDAPYP
jgi:hypothetical protein